MTSFKKAVSLLLCLLMCLSLFPTAAFAAEPVTEGDAAQTELLDSAAGAENPEEPEEAALEDTEEEGETPAAAEENPEAPAPAEEEEQLPEPAGESEEEAAPVEEPEEGTEPEEDAEDEEIEIYVEPSIISYAPGAGEDDGSLLDEYAYKQLYSLRPQGMTINAVHDSGLRLEGADRAAFYNLKDQIAAVAAGERTSTVLTISVQELNLDKTSWTAAELGLDSLVVEGPDGTPTYSDEAMEAVSEQVGFTLQKVVTALLSDCPYELYWYDKTIGTVLKPYSVTGTANTINIVGSMTFYFNVNGVYCDGTTITLESGQVVRCGINPDTGAAVSAAVSNAGYIVARYAGLSDYEKLLGFKNEICSLVSYNNDALNPGVDYGDPWQIIYVFDGRENTNVVCEGYAKAFQYLCDIGNLSGKMMTYAVSGTMRGGTGAGSHMWNIVRMENKKNYIVDVTNCDEGSIGAPDKLFLSGVTSGSVAEGYTVVIGDSSITYEYEEKVIGNFSTAELTISNHSYLEDISQHGDSEVWNLAQLKAALAAFEESGETGTLTYPGDGDFYVGEDVAIPSGVTFTIDHGSLYVSADATMSVEGGTVTTKSAVVDGTLNVASQGTFNVKYNGSAMTVNGTVNVAAGSTLNVNYSGSQLTVNGTLENAGTVKVLTLTVGGEVRVLSGGYLNMYITGSALSVATGGSLRVLSGGRANVNSGTSVMNVYGALENAGTLTVYTLNVEGTGNVLTGGKLELMYLDVSGTLENAGTVTSHNPAFVRTEKMLAGGGSYIVDVKPNTEAALREVCSKASKCVKDTAISYKITLNAAAALTSNLTVPKNVSLTLASAITVPSGLCLTNNGYIKANAAMYVVGMVNNRGNLEFAASQNLSGVMLNNGDLKLLNSVTAAFTDYAGTGTLGVYRDGTDPFTRLSGVTESMFEYVLGYTNGFYGLKLLESAGTDPVMVTAQLASLKLDGTIGVNYKVTMSESVLAKENVQAVFIYKDVEYPSSIQGMTPDSNGYYAFTFNIPAAEFANTVSLKFVDGENVIPFMNNGARLKNDTLNYSAQQYANSVTNQYDFYSLVQMLNSYCYHAYISLNKADPDVLPKAVTTDPAIDSVTAQDLYSCRNRGTGSVTGLTLSQISLNLESTTEINIKMILADGYSIEDYSFLLDGAEVTPVKNGSFYVVTIRNIGAKDLDRMYKLEITKGDEYQRVRTSALAYCYTVLMDPAQNEELVNVSKALYLYNQAANAYFEK